MTFKEICKNEEINAYLKKGDENLGQLGYTDHSQAHCVQVARQAGKILERFGYSDHEIELVKIAGYMHDIGNAINRTHHAEYGALLANSLLNADLANPSGSVFCSHGAGVYGETAARRKCGGCNIRSSDYR